MISLDKKKKMMHGILGVVLVLIGVLGLLLETVLTDLRNQAITKNILGFTITILLSIFIICSLLISLRYAFKKSESDDEMSEKNTCKAQAKVYNLLTISFNIYLVATILIPHIVMDKNVLIIMIGICSILEYYFFHNYEKKGDFDD